VQEATPAFKGASYQKVLWPVQQTHPVRITDSADGIDALPVHKALKLKTARIQKTSHRVETQALDAHDITRQKGDICGIHIEAYAPAHPAPASLTL
jgi:hypothetical protein